MNSKRARLLFALLSITIVPAAASLVGAAQRVYFPGNGVTLPVVVKEVRPTYPPAALNEQITGTVLIESVVEPDGSVGSVRILRSLDAAHGFDKAAVDAMKQWRFKPGMKDGKAVPVRITCELTFTTR